MESSKVVCTHLSTHFKLRSSKIPSSEDQMFDMKSVPYAHVVGTLMYAMVCTIPDIAQWCRFIEGVVLVNKYFPNNPVLFVKVVAHNL